MSHLPRQQRGHSRMLGRRPKARGWSVEDAHCLVLEMMESLWPDVPEWVLEKTLTVNMVAKLKSALSFLPPADRL